MFRPRYLLLKLHGGVDQPHPPKRLRVGEAGGADQPLLAAVVLEGHRLEPLGRLAARRATLLAALSHSGSKLRLELEEQKMFMLSWKKMSEI